MNDATDSSGLTKAQALLKNGQLMAGIEQLLNFLRAEPENQDALQLMAYVSSNLVDKNQSIALINDCINKGITSHILLYELGSSFLSLGKYPEAIDAFKAVLTKYPNSFEALHDLGAAYALWGKKNEALESFLKAATIYDKSADLFYNLGRLYDDRFELARAVELYQKAVHLDPCHTEALINLAIDLSAYKRYAEALTYFEKAYSQNPQVDFLYGDCVYTRMRMCNWDGFQGIEDELKKGINNGQKLIAPFPISALLDSPELILKSARIYSQAEYPNNNLLGPPNKYFGEKIRIGYFSPDFHEHPVSHLMAEVFELHDRNRFEIYAFSFGKDSDDAMRNRLKSSFDQFIDVANKTSEEIACLARKMEIDIAIDLCGFTENARTEVFALRAAPIQVSYIGFLGTMGADYIDYLIADKVIIPSHLRQFYSEKIIYLPSYQANDSRRQSGSKSFTKEDFDISDDQFVFCNLNSVYKITKSVFDSWLKILNSVQKSVLLLYGENLYAIQNLKNYALKHGIDPKRLIFVEHLPRADYLSRYRIVDLFLDTYPYNAGATASDALWMDIPVLTLQGSSFPSRVASSLLTNLHLPELIQSTLKNYEQQAIELALDPAKLAQIKKRLIHNKSSAPLFNSALFVQHLEKALIKAAALCKNNSECEDIF